MSVFTNPASRSAQQATAYTAAVLDLLGARDPVEALQNTVSALEQIRQGLSTEQITRPEAPGKWSIRHVLQHLADSELVWGYRLRMVLAHDRPPLTGYDQDLWAERLGYDEADADQALEDFGLLRRANLRLLACASDEDLKRVGVHAERGAESVEHMIRLYAGHDLLHLEQLARIRRAVTQPDIF
jgi:DinB superfamily